MDTTTPASEETGSGPTPSGRGRAGSARTGLLGAAVGVGAAVGGLLLLTGGAGAQPTADTGTITPSPATEVVVVADDGAIAEEELDGELPEELEAHWVCIDDALGAAGLDVDADVEPELTEDQWEALESGLEDCDELLPAGFFDELDAAEEAFEQCLVDNGIEFADEYDDDDEYDDELFEFEPVVFVESEDGSTLVEFGDGDGQVTIAKVDGELTVSSTGDVTSETFSWDDDSWDEEAETFELCEAELIEHEYDEDDAGDVGGSDDD